MLKSKFTAQKIKESKTFDILAMTSGYDIYNRCDPPLDKCSVYVADDRIPIGGSIVKSRIISVDTSDILIYGEFDIRITRTYWNAFQNEDQSWIGTTVRQPVYKVSLIIMLPDKKLFDDYILYVSEIGKNKQFPYSGDKIVISDKNGKYIHWKIIRPRPGHVYYIDWDW